MIEVILIAGIAAAAYALWKTFFPSEGPARDLSQGLPSKGDKKEIALEALSTLWSRKRNTEISLEQLAAFWRSQAERTQQSPEDETLSFVHPDIQGFYDEYLKGKSFSTAPAGMVIRGILGLLDREGDCPSVVNSKGEADVLLEKNAYDLLAGIPLYRHSLNVSEEMIKAFKASVAMLPKILIVSLGHDLGKLPSFRKTLYSMGDHPLISVTVLEGLQGYNELSYKDEINRAIVSHHRNPQGLLEGKLKEADQAARRMELARNVREHLEGPAGAGPEKAEKPPLPPASSASAGQQAGQEPIDKESIFITHAKEEKEKVSMKEIPLPWFDAGKFLAELKVYINRMVGPRWSAFSMPDGHVYFHPGAIEEAAKKLGKGDPNITLMDSDKELKRNILYSVIYSLRREKDAIARGLIKDGFFGGPFIIRMQDGREISSYYTPFNAETFGESVSYFEAMKEGKIKEIEDVRPKVGK